MKVAALAPAAVLSWSSNWGPLKRGLQGAEEMIPSGVGWGGCGLCGEGGIVRRGWQELLGEATCGGSLCSLPVDEKRTVLCLSKNK